MNDFNHYSQGLKCINLTDKFNEVQGINPNIEQIEQMKNYINENNGKNKYENFFISNKKSNKDENEIENNNYIYKTKNINLKEYKKLIFDDINDDNSSSIKYNINENIKVNSEKDNDNDNDKSSGNAINITLESSSVLSDLKSFYGTNTTKNEFIFNPLNSNVLSNFSLSQKENITENQIENQNLNINKKSLKNNELSTSNINSNIIINTNEKPIFKCNCKNSNCLKFYCECFANGKFCDNDNCTCINCKNTPENKEIRLKQYNIIISRNPKAIQKINSSKKSWTCKCKNSNCSKKYCECFQNRRTCTSKCRCVNCLNKNKGNKKNNNERKIKRIRGLKNDKTCQTTRRNNIIKNDENIINKENKKDENLYMKFYTPKKLENHLKSNLYNYQKEITTADLTDKNEKRKVFDYKTDKKRADIYTKLNMDNI